MVSGLLWKQILRQGAVTWKGVFLFKTKTLY